MRDDLKIPYGISDFKRLRQEKYYYVNFKSLFGDLAIGGNPTDSENRYQILYLDFSQVNRGANLSLQARFDAYMGVRLDGFVDAYAEYYDADFIREFKSAQDDIPA